ncbi:MAG TPA: translation elongation factor Ts [Burkholderiales bacterium]|nr:translation elongation factor Ts [Burkholderiales bacterium]
MAQISAALVKELRELTGLGMMECKKALAEAGGDLRKAEELLRIRSGAKASKVADRVAAEGVVGAWLSPDAKLGALAEVNCETDFVAKNEDFVAFARGVAEAVAKTNPADAQGLTSFEPRRQALVQKIGENISIRRFARVQAAGQLALYLHGAKIGVLVDYEGAEDLGKDMAMHIAAFKPQYLSKADVPDEVVARERDIAKARALESGKPPEIVVKMVEGAVNKFLNDVTLLGQPFVKDDKQSVEKLLAAKKAKLNGYRFLVVGEGISK